MALVTLYAGCTTPTLSTDEQAIIGGQRSTGASATVLLAGFPPDRSVVHSCTAVLVAPTVLLTSAHCIDAPNHPSYQWGVFPGDDASAYPTLVELEPELLPVAAVYPHPQYQTQLPFFADIGAVVLAAPLAVTPMPLQRDPLDQTIVGKPALIVGYGQTVYQTFNQARHEAMTVVAAIEDDTIVVGDAQRRACLGDSGGPAIVDGKLVGVDSYGPTGCGEPAHYRRIDYFLPFIDGHITPAGGNDAGPTGPDPEPPGDMTDEGGCAAGGGGSLPLALGALGLLALGRRRRGHGIADA